MCFKEIIFLKEINEFNMFGRIYELRRKFLLLYLFYNILFYLFKGIVYFIFLERKNVIRFWIE